MKQQPLKILHFSLMIALVWGGSFLAMAPGFGQTSGQTSEPVFVSPGISSGEVNGIIQKMKPGEKLVFRAGSYRFERTIGIREKSSIVIEGQGKVEIILDKKDSVVFYITGSDNTEIRNISARHETPIQPGVFCTAGVVLINTSHDILLEKLELNGSGTHGVEIFRATSVTVRDSYLHHNSVAAIGLYRPLDHIQIQNIKADHNPEFIETDLEELSSHVELANSPLE